MTDRPDSGVVLHRLQSEFDQMTYDRYAVGVNPHTLEVYMVHTEGVTYRVSHGKPWRFNDFNLQSRFYTVLEVLEMRDLSHTVDLAQWIRQFGDRLESNYHLAFEALTTHGTSEHYDAQVKEVLQRDFGHLFKTD